MRKFTSSDIKKTTSIRGFKKEFKKHIARIGGLSHWDKIAPPDMSILLLKK